MPRGDLVAVTASHLGRGGGVGTKAAGCCPPQGRRGGEWVLLNKILRQQEEGKADKNAQSSCGNVGNEVTPQSAVAYFEAYHLWLV